MLQNLLYTLYCLWSYDWHVKSRNQKGVYNCIILVFLENMLILCLSTWYLMGKGWSPVMNEFSSPDFVDIIFLNVLFFSEICSFMLKPVHSSGCIFPCLNFFLHSWQLFEYPNSKMNFNLTCVLQIISLNSHFTFLDFSTSLISR